MSKTLYVGNLPWATSEDDLRQLFGRHAEVGGVRIITDRETGRSRGFGFVDVDEARAEAAIEALNGAEIDGRALVVTEAKSRQPM